MTIEIRIAIDIHDQIASLPKAARVYFFYDAKKTIIYIGKSINIQQRVKQHFSGKDRKSQKLQHFTKYVSYKLMGSELISLLYESHLIKKHHPIYNRSQRRKIYQYGLFLSNTNGYQALTIGKIASVSKVITTFSTLNEAKEMLFRITEKYQLCQKINGLYKTKSSCFQYQLKMCFGACLSMEAPDSYNQRVNEFISKTKLQDYTSLIELEGRSEDELGLVYIKNGNYKGFGFCPMNTPKQTQLKFITPYENNRDIQRILVRYVTNRP
ncbi:MAG: GIY-YIG nuclease family protein [Galbibacter orientalis]